MGIPMQDHRQDRFIGSEIGRREERLREAATRRAEVSEDAVAKGRISMKRMSGLHNPADVLTKPKDRTELGRLLCHVGARYVS